MIEKGLAVIGSVDEDGESLFAGDEHIYVCQADDMVSIFPESGEILVSPEDAIRFALSIMESAYLAANHVLP